MNLTPRDGVVLVTRCGCKRYEDWPAWSMNEEIRIPLPYYGDDTPWEAKEIDASLPDVRRFRANGLSELVHGDKKDKFYRIYRES